MVEGFKRDAFPKLEIHRAANGKSLIHPEDPHVVAIASDVALPQAKVPVIDLNDIEVVADLLLERAVPVFVRREPFPECPVASGSGRAVDPPSSGWRSRSRKRRAVALNG